MKTLVDASAVDTTRARAGALRRLRSAALLVGLVLMLPACTLDRSPILPAYHVYTATAMVRDGAGNVVPVSSDDPLFAGGAARVFATWDGVDSTGATAAARMEAQWTRYLRRRLEDPSASAEFRARFGNAPFCLLTATVVRQEATTGAPGPDEAGSPLAGCGAPPLPAACGNPPGVTPTVSVSTPAVDFGSVPVGTSSGDAFVTISNSGAGRLCLSAPALDPALSPQLGDFSLDASDCAPRSAEEIAAGYTFLEAARPACNVRLGLTPSDPGTRRAVLRVSSGDLLTPIVDVPAAGFGQAGVLRASPSPLCLNTPPVPVPGMGMCHRNNLTLINDGPGRVDVRSLALPAGALTDWAVGGYVPAPPPLTLAPGGTLSMTVRLCNADPPDTMLIVSSNSTTPVLEVPFLSFTSGCTP
jgi:hypothetical protein